MRMELLAITEKIEDNKKFDDNPDSQYHLYMTNDFYKKIGYNPPWISYFAKTGGQLVGFGLFKGPPINCAIEIAYATFKTFRRKGIGTKLCSMLVELSLATDSMVIITARTLPKTNYSTRILEKNNFELLGTVMDKDDGEVWEWKYKP